MRDLDLLAPIERLEEVDSTNLAARRAVESGELAGSGRMLVAKRQTAGRGRFGRAWASPEGGLWCTLAWPVSLDPARVLEGLGLRVGVACAHAVEHALAAHGHGEGVRLKWPNDVLVNGKKALGALCEALERDGKTYILVGVGVNVNFPESAFPPEVRPLATTLSTVVHGQVNLERLLHDLRERLVQALMTEGLTKGLVNDARAHLFGVGSQATISLADGSKKGGVLSGLTDDGRVRLDTPEGPYVAPAGADVQHLITP